MYMRMELLVFNHLSINRVSVKNVLITQKSLFKKTKQTLLSHPTKYFQTYYFGQESIQRISAQRHFYSGRNFGLK